MTEPQDDFDPGPHVCGGCFAVGDEPCKPGCIFAAAAREREEECDNGPDSDWGDE